MQCPQCGAGNRSGARFCKQCRTPLITEPQARLATHMELADRDTSNALPSPTVPPPPEPPTQANEEQARPHNAEPDPTHAGVYDVETDNTESPVDPSLSTAGREGQTEEVPRRGDQMMIVHSSDASSPREEEVPLSLTSDTTAPSPPGLTHLPPLAPGTVVAERFEIVEVLIEEESTNLYKVLDRAACSSCGALTSPDATYCNECGRQLTDDAPLIGKLREAARPEILDGPPGDNFAFNERFYEALTSAIDEPATSTVHRGLKGITFTIGYGTDTGQVRDLDEDSLFVFQLSGIYESVASPTLGLFVVADGMGGYEGGEIASKKTVKLIAEEIVHQLLLTFAFKTEEGSDVVTADVIRTTIIDAVDRANEWLYNEVQQQANEMGCTLTLALVLNDTAYVANVGDSRTYLWRGGELNQITTDHSLVASLIAAGTAEPHEIYTHPDRHVVYRSMGNKPEVEVDTWAQTLQPDDLLLLCCDGLWESIRDEGIQEILLTHFDPQSACTEMIRRANLAGGEDNISAILVKVGPTPSP